MTVMPRKAFIVLAIAQLAAAPSHAQTECAEKARSAALQATQEVAAEGSFVITKNASQPILDQIVREACDRSRRLSVASAEDAARKIARRYFGNADSLGRSARVASLLAEVLGGDIGLGRVDWRSYGALTIKCPASLVSAVVAFGKSEAGSCGARFLLPAGSMDVRVQSGATTVCIAKADVKARSDLTCDCAPGAQPPSFMNCS